MATLPNHTPIGELVRAIAWRGLAFMALEFLETIGLAVFFYAGVSLATARVVVDGPSMRPTLASGEWIVVNRLAYLRGKPQRGDIVVILPPMSDQPDDLIKRVVGQPGETIQVHGGSVFIDGQRLDEPYAIGRSFPEGEWKLGPDQIFLMGDNRELSLDSRAFGPVELTKIVGKAEIIYWPPAEWGLVSWRAASVKENGKGAPTPSPMGYPSP
jgi:signal peptidase I